MKMLRKIGTIVLFCALPLRGHTPHSILEDESGNLFTQVQQGWAIIPVENNLTKELILKLKNAISNKESNVKYNIFSSPLEWHEKDYFLQT